MSAAKDMAYAQLVAGLMLADGTVTVAETMFLTELLARLGMDASEHRALWMTSGGGETVTGTLAQLDAERRSTLLVDLEAAAIADGIKVAEEQEFIDKVALLLADY